MALFKYTILVLGLLLVFTSCSKKIKEGFYVNKQDYNQDDQSTKFAYLQLNQDSTFVYEDFIMQYETDDVGPTHLGYFGGGKYKIGKHHVILTFDYRFETKIEKLKIDARFILPTPTNKDRYAYYSAGQGGSPELAHGPHLELSPRLIRNRHLIGPLKSNEMIKALNKVRVYPPELTDK